MTLATTPSPAARAPAPASLKGVVAAPTAISTVDGEAGRLIYRGYSIEDLAEHVSYEETVHLLWDGELPTAVELDALRGHLAAGRALPPRLLDHLQMLPRSAHPLAVLRTAVSLLDLLDPEAESMDRAATRRKGERLLGQVGTVVAAWARLRDGRAPVAPRPDLDTAANLLWMLFGEEPDPLAAHALDVSLTLHAEHELNASTFAARVAAGTYLDIHGIVVAALATLKGPRHGGANEDVIDMVNQIGTPERAEPWVRERLARRAAATSEERLDPKLRFPGFGHAVYRVLDPRARQLSALSAAVARSRGVSGIAEIQATVRSIVEAELGFYPNVDYYSAGLYHALGIPSALFTSIFAQARTAGYIAHAEEQLYGGGRLIRPRGEYTGPAPRVVVPLEQRG